MGGGHGIGVKRNSYHRRNRRRNISMHKRSHGANEPSQIFEKNGVRVVILQRSVLEGRAIDRYRRFNKQQIPYAWDLNRIVVMYVRHQLTNYNELTRDVDRECYLAASESVFDAVGCAYPWLAEECLKQHLYRAENGRYGAVRVVKHAAILPRNAWDDCVADLDEDDAEHVSQRGALSSLASSRLIFFPPFLKPWEIQSRRFGGQLDMNDRWWEWEAELGIHSYEGRPHDGPA